MARRSIFDTRKKVVVLKEKIKISFPPCLASINLKIETIQARKDSNEVGFHENDFLIAGAIINQ